MLCKILNIEKYETKDKEETRVEVVKENFCINSSEMK